MAADLSTLIPEFRTRLNQLILSCASQGTEMRCYVTLRDPFEQARLWRQSRSIEEIGEKVQSLRTARANFLAHCIDSVGPQNGDPVTNAIPGLSWHQWGEAADCFWVVDGQAEWSTTKLVNGSNGYRVYATTAAQFQLTAGGSWPRFKDWPHVQRRSAGSPLSELSLQQVDKEMELRFG